MRGVKELLNKNGYLLVSNGRQEQTYISERVRGNINDKCQ